MRFVVLTLLTAICGSVAAQVLSGTALAVAPGLLVTNQQVVKVDPVVKTIMQ